MQEKDEVAVEYLSRISNFLDSEDSNITFELPTLQSAIEYCQIVVDHYQVESLEGVYLSIEECIDFVTDFSPIQNKDLNELCKEVFERRKIG